MINEDYLDYLAKLKILKNWKSFLSPSEIIYAKKLYPEEKFTEDIIFTCKYCNYDNRYTITKCQKCGRQHKY